MDIPKIKLGLGQTSNVHSLALWECPPKPPKPKGEAMSQIRALDEVIAY